MDSFEFNKIAGGLLVTLLFTMALGVFSDAVFSHPKLAKPGYDLPAAEEASLEAGNAPAAAAPLPERLAKADPKKGEAIAKDCAACHNFEKGAGAKIGPPLYGVVDRQRASIPGFAYSDAMKSKPGNWTFDELDKFIANPKGDIPGTKMAFAGEKDPQKRADIVDYLNSLSDSPKPLPQPTAAAGAPASQETQGSGQQPAATAPKGQQPAPATVPPTKTEAPK
ncbi:MAG: cytochrome c family protein [Methylobacteriaceae bacterium]|nr:cytochrome c family protein [Methylobacteriaceae bacterium]